VLLLSPLGHARNLDVLLNCLGDRFVADDGQAAPNGSISKVVSVISAAPRPMFTNFEILLRSRSAGIANEPPDL
jgi:hypothetical protein